MPYVYVPSAQASYVKIVTPWGELHLEKDVVLKIVVSVSVLLATVVLYRLCVASGKSKKKSKKGKKKQAKEPQLKPRGDVDAAGEESSEEEEESDDEEEYEDDGRSALDENILKKGENSYYYAHQRREVKDSDEKDAIKKTMISTYGWTDSKNTVRYERTRSRSVVYCKCPLTLMNGMNRQYLFARRCSQRHAR